MLRVMETDTGESWAEYEVTAFRPRQAKALAEGTDEDVGVEIVIDRCITRFLATHFPGYRRSDVTDILINAEPGKPGFIKYRVGLSFTDVEKEQI